MHEPVTIKDEGKLNIEKLDIERIRKDFPILSHKVNGSPLIWLDNAATSQKPRIVIDTIKEFYETQRYYFINLISLFCFLSDFFRI